MRAAARKAARERTTPLGAPVEPEVKRTASVSAATSGIGWKAIGRPASSAA